MMTSVPSDDLDTSPIPVRWSEVLAQLAKAAELADGALSAADRDTAYIALSDALDHCQQAMRLMAESDTLHFPLLVDAHIAATSTLFKLYVVTEELDIREALAGMMEAYGENLGAAIGYDAQDRETGNHLLFLAQNLKSLAEALPDPAERMEAQTAVQDLAMGAANLLWRTSDQALTAQALQLARESHLQSNQLVCSQCHRPNPVDYEFCGACGSRLMAPTPGFCPSCHRSNPANMRYCGHCGSPLLPR